MWAHSYLAMTHLNEGDERIKQDYLAQVFVIKYGGVMLQVCAPLQEKEINMSLMVLKHYERCLC
jgi:hypothetical protein